MSHCVYWHPIMLHLHTQWIHTEVKSNLVARDPLWRTVACYGIIHETCSCIQLVNYNEGIRVSIFNDECLFTKCIETFCLPPPFLLLLVFFHVRQPVWDYWFFNLTTNYSIKFVACDIQNNISYRKCGNKHFVSKQDVQVKCFQGLQCCLE